MLELFAIMSARWIILTKILYPFLWATAPDLQFNRLTTYVGGQIDWDLMEFAKYSKIQKLYVIYPVLENYKFDMK